MISSHPLKLANVQLRLYDVHRSVYDYDDYSVIYASRPGAYLQGSSQVAGATMRAVSHGTLMGRIK